MKNIILKWAPVQVQDFAIGVFNSRQYRRRHCGRYPFWKQYFASWESAPRERLEAEQARRLSEFLDYVTSHSQWYKPWRERKLTDFPLLEKADILSSLGKIATVSEKDGVTRFTGGTTGASMRVLYTHEDVQERHACLDNSRWQHGYELGKKVAWFSGKEIGRYRYSFLLSLCETFQ